LSRIIKILFINDYRTGGGAEVVLHQLMEGLNKNNFDIRFFYGLETNERKKGNPLSYIYSFHYKKELTAILNDFKPDIVHLLNYYHILSPSILDGLSDYKREFPNFKVIYTAHDFHLFAPNSGLTSFSVPGNQIIREEPIRFLHKHSESCIWFRRWDHRGYFFSLLKIFQWWIAYSLKKSDKIIDEIICPGQFMFYSMENAFPKKKIHLVRNPYIRTAKTDFLEHSESTVNNIVKFIFIGRIAQEKGLIQFINNVSENNWESIELHIYGSGPEIPELKKKIAEIKREKNCYIHNSRPHKEILDLLGNYDVLLLPSVLYENAPLSIVEASFSGLRILASNWGGIKTLSEFCGGEYLFDPENSKDLNKAIEIINYDIKKKLPIKRNYNKIKDAFLYETFLDKHSRIYKDN